MNHFPGTASCVSLCELTLIEPHRPASRTEVTHPRSIVLRWGLRAGDWGWQDAGKLGSLPTRESPHRLGLMTAGTCDKSVNRDSYYLMSKEPSYSISRPTDSPAATYALSSYLDKGTFIMTWMWLCEQRAPSHPTLGLLLLRAGLCVPACRHPAFSSKLSP